MLDCSSAIEGDWTKGEQVQKTNTEHSQENFESLFGKVGTKLKIQKELKQGGVDKYPNVIMAHRDHVILLQVNNIKHVSKWVQNGYDGPLPHYEEKKEESNPPCYVIIDNREGVGQMAIQIESSAWSDTDKLIELLRDSFNEELQERFGLQIKFQPKTFTREMMTYIRQREQDEGIGVKKIEYTFTNPKLIGPLDASIHITRRIEELFSLIDQLSGKEAKLTVTPATNAIMLRKKRLDDFKTMLAVSSNNAFDVSVTFTDDEVLKTSEKKKATFELLEGVITDFVNGIHADLFGYGLTKWLDKVREDVKNYDDGEQIKRKPSRKGRKAVS